MSKKSILCVDDELIIVQTLKIILKTHFGGAYNYEGATSGEEGLKIVQELSGTGSDIVLIISDWLMPGMKGDEFLAEVKKNYPEIPSLIITGHIDPKAEDLIIQKSGCVKVLYKPWHTQFLFDTIKECLKLKASSE